MQRRKLLDLNQGMVKKEKKSRKVGYNILDKEGNRRAFGAGNPLKYGFEFIVYEDESLEKKMFKIAQEDVLGRKFKFKIIDKINDEKIGSIERKKKNSFSKDLWKIKDNGNNQVAKVEETSRYKAIIREYIIGTLPIKYDILVGDRKIGSVYQNFSINSSVFNFKLNERANLDSRLLFAIIFCVDNL